MFRLDHSNKSETVMGFIHMAIAIFLLAFVLPATLSIGCAAAMGFVSTIVVAASGFFMFISYRHLRHFIIYEKKVNPLDVPIDLDQLHGEAPHIDDED